MKVRRTISIDKGDLDTLKTFLDSNGNNLSLALRQLINNYRQLTDLSKINADQQKIMMLRNQIIENRIAALLPVPLIKWLVKRSHGVPPPLGTFRVIMEKYTRLLGIDSLSLNDYIKMINAHGDIFGYQISQEIEISPDSRSIRISFEAEDHDNLKGAVLHYSCMLAHNPLKLKTKNVIESPNLIIVDYEQCGSELEAYESVTHHFGHTRLIFDEFLNNIQFWSNVLDIVRADRYADIILSRSIFLQILKSHDFSGQLNHLISSIYGVSIEDAEYPDIIQYIEKICKTNGLIERIETKNNEIKIYHIFDDRDVIQIINSTILKTLEMSGRHFMLKKRDKMTILSRK